MVSMTAVGCCSGRVDRAATVIASIDIAVAETEEECMDAVDSGLEAAGPLESRSSILLLPSISRISFLLYWFQKVE